MSFFGYQGSPAASAAYDLCILEELEKEQKEEALRKTYSPNGSVAPTEEEWA